MIRSIAKVNYLVFKDNFSVLLRLIQIHNLLLQEVEYFLKKGCSVLLRSVNIDDSEQIIQLLLKDRV